MSIANSVCILISLFLCLQGCTQDYEQAAAQRSEHARSHQGDIVIVGIEEPEAEKTDYIKGIQLAVEEINQRPNKLLGRSLKLIIEQDGTDFDSVLPTLQSISENPEVTAVLGHRRSSIAVPASVIYEKSQIIFLPPFVTAQGLTNHSFRFVFRMIPNIAAITEQLASIAQILGYQKLISLYDYSDYHRELAFSFENTALKQNIEFVFRSSFSPKNDDYRSLIAQFQNEAFDAIFLSTNNASSVRLIQQLREMGLDVPILSGDGIREKAFSQAAGAAGDNTIIPMVYRASQKTALNRHFKAQYKKKYEIEADYNAAQGYDSVMLLVAVIEQVKSTIPTNLSSTMRYLPYWHGVTGLHAFNHEGEILGKHYYFQVMKNGQWHILPALHKPYNLERFQQHRGIIKLGTKITDFRRQFAKRLHPIDFKKTLLDLLHEILGYHRLGWIHDASDREASRVEKQWLQKLARHKKFTLDDCGVFFASLSPEEAEKNLIDCYGRLATQVDAIYITPSAAMKPSVMKRINRALRPYQVPTLAFQTEDGSTPSDHMGFTLLLGRPKIVKALNSPEFMTVLSGLLTKMKAFELVDKLANMPVIQADLKTLSEYGYLNSKELLMLAPVSIEKQPIVSIKQ